MTCGVFRDSIKPYRLRIRFSKKCFIVSILVSLTRHSLPAALGRVSIPDHYLVQYLSSNNQMLLREWSDIEIKCSMHSSRRKSLWHVYCIFMLYQKKFNMQ